MPSRDAYEIGASGMLGSPHGKCRPTYEKGVVMSRERPRGGNAMTRCTRREFLVSAAVAAALAGPRAPRVASAQTSVKLGTAVLGDYALAGPFIVAMDKGYLKAENLNAEFIPFRGGPDLVKAVIAGEILIGAAGSTDILVAREAGQPLKMSATHTEGNHFTLNVATDVQSVAELKGKADRKSTRLNSSHSQISYAVFC